VSASYNAESQTYRVTWTADARKLRSNDKQAVSPPFELSLGPQFPRVIFKMMAYPKIMGDGKGGASFKKANGRGFVQLKCESELTDVVGAITFRISIGNAPTAQAPRGPVAHNFASSAVCGLPRENGVEEWDFSAVVDQESLTFVVCLEMMPQNAGAWSGRAALL
jgi:hypothetical protein